MNYKKITCYVLVTILGILLFNLLTANHLEMQQAANKLEAEKLPRLHFIRVIYGLLLGLLVKWQIIIESFKGNKQLNLKLLLGVMLFLISLIPPITAMEQFSINMPFPRASIGMNMIKAPFLYGFNQLVLSVVSGVVIAEGFYKEQNVLKQ
ncbi:MAG: hypothetical protein JJT76_19915 [Clostridiaceae bacterium]|nr:hypothetical protein [Clostridiaceae bacterium]